MTPRISLSARWVDKVPPIMQRFLDEHADADPTECWIWPGARSAYGYGQVWYFDAYRHRGRSTGAHRLAYVLTFGDDLYHGTVLDHFACDNGHLGCANPYHVRPVTPRENTLRSEVAVPAINYRKTHCVRGHELPPVKPRHGRTCFECARVRYREGKVKR